MSSVVFSNDIQENYDSCHDFAVFVDECVDDFIDNDEEEPKAYSIPDFIAENEDEYDDSHCREIEIKLKKNGDVKVRYSRY